MIRRHVAATLWASTFWAAPLWAAVALVAITPPALAQMETREGIALQNQILQLRHELQELRDRGGGGGGGDSVLSGQSAPAGGDLVPQLLARVQALEDAMRSVQGRLDELQNTQQRHYEDLAKQIGDLNFKLGAGAGAGASGVPAIPSVAPPPPVLSPTPGALGRPAAQAPATSATGDLPRTPERGIAEAQAALSRHDYPAAEAAARDVLQTNRTSPRAYDAQYLLAQALAGKRDYPQAAIAYDDAYNRGRTGTHAPEALLGLASSLSAIGEKRAACETLVKLGREFPSSRPGVREAAGAIRQRAACQ